MSNQGDPGLAKAAADDARAHLERLAAIGTYAAAIVHELSNPLAATRAALNAARHASGAKARRRWLRAIERATEREAQLLESVLRFAREGVLRTVDAELEGILRCAEHAVCDDDATANLSVEIEIAGGAERARCNPAALEQVLIDLLRNAAEASSARTRIRVECEEDRIALTVADDGTGPGQNDPEDLFLPGYSTKVDHAGLGLFFARALVTAQGGDIAARRRGHGGTEFVLRLRRVAG